MLYQDVVGLTCLWICIFALYWGIMFMILLHFNSCKCREIIVYMYWGTPDIFVYSFMVCLAICRLSRECRKFVNWFPSCKLTISNQRSSSIFAVYRRIKKVLDVLFGNWFRSCSLSVSRKPARQICCCKWLCWLFSNVFVLQFIITI